MTRRISSNSDASNGDASDGKTSNDNALNGGASKRTTPRKAHSRTPRRAASSDAVKSPKEKVSQGSNSRKHGSEGKRDARIASSGNSRSKGIDSKADGFVDARRMRSNKDVNTRLSQAGVSDEGVFTRPKVIDFTQRLREKRQANAHVVMKRVLIVVSTVALLCALLWFLLLSPVFLLNASSIKVSGTNTWVSASRIEDIAKQQLGTSLFIVSTGDMEEQIGELPGVTSATVHKDFPDGVNIDVNAQRPAAVLKDAKGALTAVDKEARVLNAVGASVDGIPIIEVSSVGKGTDDAAVKQALKVLAVLPESMRKQITKVSASTQDSITTEISNGQYVIVWGDSSQIALKKAVVDKIINDPTKIGDKHQVDVSAPLRPIIK